MAAPGLVMFLGRLVRRKNVLNFMMQYICLIGLMTVVWAFYGYYLTLGGSPREGDNPRISDSEFLLRNHMSWSREEATGAPTTLTPAGELRLTTLTYISLQGISFIVTPALICESFAKHMQFSAMTLFLIL